MNKKLILGAAAGVAAVALAVGGTTYSAWSDFGQVNGNSVAAGFLKLDLNGQDGSSAVAPLNWGSLAPAMTSNRTVWVASNDGQSVPDANLSATISNLDDQENNCSSNSEKIADPTCVNNAANSGDLSHILNFQIGYYPLDTTADQCKAYANQNMPPATNQNVLPSNYQGDLFADAEGAGHTYTLKNSAGTGDLVLAPGDGICIGFGAYWPHEPSNQVSPPYNNDNVAQGDSFTFDVQFNLTQV